MRKFTSLAAVAAVAAIVTISDAGPMLAAATAAYAVPASQVQTITREHVNITGRSNEPNSEPNIHRLSEDSKEYALLWGLYRLFSAADAPQTQQVAWAWRWWIDLLV